MLHRLFTLQSAERLRSLQHFSKLAQDMEQARLRVVQAQRGYSESTRL